MHDRFLLVGFYDLIGETVVSYQVYNSYGDFLRSIVRAAHDKTLPFSQFSNDYKVVLTGYMERDKCFVLSGLTDFGFPFDYNFADIIQASTGMDPNLDFDTSLFLNNLTSLNSCEVKTDD